MASIRENVAAIKSTLPAHVRLVAAAKTQTPEAVREAVGAGVTIIGHNYVQEAKTLFEAVGRAGAEWHFIGHLQTNKARDAAKLFDTVQTVDSERIAQALEKECAKLGKTLNVLIEVNSAGEEQKAGAAPETVWALAEAIRKLPHLKLTGLMTMGPAGAVENPKEFRPYFRKTREVFENLKNAGYNLDTLSMGMTDSYKIAVEEGSNMVRVGTLIFGMRHYS